MGYTDICLRCFFCLFYTYIRTYKCDICDLSELTYNMIGQNITILDVKASDISALQTSCSKRIKIPGIVNATLSVETADFSSDIYWAYNSNYGTARRLYYDEAYIYFGKCPPTKHEMVKVREGLVAVFSSSELCIRFEPDTDFRHLGGHVEGGRVKITVRVNTAVCNTIGNRTQADRTDRCHNLCSASGAVKECHNVSGSRRYVHECRQSITSGDDVIRSKQRVYDKTFKFKCKQFGTNQADPDSVNQPQVRTTVSSRNPNKSYASISQSSASQWSAPSTTAAHGWSESPPTGNAARRTESTERLAPVSTRTFIAVRTTTSSTVASKQSTHVSTLSTPFVYVLSASSLLSATTTVRDIKTTKHLHATIVSSSSTGLVQRRTTPVQEERGNEAFGLVEGLCIFGGCFLFIAIATTVACCISSRKRKCFRLKEPVAVPPSDTNSFHTPTSNYKELLWRDNWLVRYHNNPTFIQTENDIDSLQDGIFEHQDQDCVTICQFDSCGRTVEENPYDNPWPFVRLGSDFVRNTKKLERELTQEGCASSETASGYNTIATADRSTNYSENNKELTETVIKNPETSRNAGCVSLLSDKTFNQDGTSYQKNESVSPIKGIYNIIRIKRVSSKSEKDSHMNSSEMKAERRMVENSGLGISGNIIRSNSEASYWYYDKLSRVNSNHASYSSSMHSKEHTSMCSDCNVSFEGLIQHEIGKIEGVLDDEANDDLESTGSVNDNAKRKEWKVNTLFAVVSQRGQAPLPCGTSGTLQFPKL